MTLLTLPQLFTEIDYAARSGMTSYPEAVSLPVVHPGRLKRSHLATGSRLRRHPYSEHRIVWSSEARATG